MYEKTKNNPNHLRKVLAGATIGIVAVGSAIFGATKWAESFSKVPTELPVAAAIKPALPKPEANFDTTYEAHIGEDADSIMSTVYPNVKEGTTKYIRIRNMINNQIDPFDELNREHPGNRSVSAGPEPIQLTASAKIPEQNTEAFYVGDWKHAKEIAARNGSVG